MCNVGGWCSRTAALNAHDPSTGELLVHTAKPTVCRMYGRRPARPRSAEDQEAHFKPCKSGKGDGHHSQGNQAGVAAPKLHAYLCYLYPFNDKFVNLTSCFVKMVSDLHQAHYGRFGHTIRLWDACRRGDKLDAPPLWRWVQRRHRHQSSQCVGERKSDSVIACHQSACIPHTSVVYSIHMWRN